MVKEEKEISENYELVEVPTGQAVAIKTPDGETIAVEQALVEILNKLTQIVKSVS